MGTAAYMSPEQVRGQPVDARSDLFSLGCVLYELLTGSRLFRGHTFAETAAAILYFDPPPLASLGVTVSPEVERVLQNCLAKDPGQRLASARDLAFALRAVLNRSDDSRPTPTTPESPQRSPRRSSRGRGSAVPSLAVLPLANTNVDPDTEYLSDGITESLINSLSQLPGLRVMARSTVFRCKNKDMSPQEVGRALKVRAVLLGQLFQRGDRLILKFELVNVKDGAQLWGKQYSQPLAGLSAMEKAITQEIADQLHLRLTGEQKRRLGQPLVTNPDAYPCYLKGRYHWNKRTEEGLKKSIKLFEQAIDLDPTYALAYTGMADAYLNLGGWGHLRYDEAYPRARAAAQRALAIDEALAEAHVSLAMVLKEYDWDWPAAGREYLRALELNPNYAIAHQWYGEYLGALGRSEEAIAAMKRAIELDPLSLIIQATLGRHGYYFARRYEEAIAQFHKTLEMDENFWVAHHFLGWTYAQIGRLPEALAEAEKAQRLTENLEIIAVLGHIHARAGRLRQAQEALDELQRLAATRCVSTSLPALVAIGLGDHDRAFAWLEQACDDRSQMMSELRAEAAFDPLRSDKRFTHLLRRVGLEAIGGP
jgi:serine/threonine-protein kinase